MRVRLGLAAFALVFSTTAFGYDADWWYAKYQKLGDHNPKWDSLVREGIDHWEASGDTKGDRSPQVELALSVKALEKAYEAGCRCPIALFIDARNTMLITADGTTVFDRFRESLKLTENRPELTFVRIPCANALGRRYMNSGEYREAIPYFETALALSSADVDEGVFKEAKANLQEGKERLAAQEKQRAGLAALALPPHPTREQARAYVRGILHSAVEKTSAGNQDPEIAMLEKVGPENLDALLETWGAEGKQGWVADDYMKAAVAGLARPEHMALLLKWLPFHETLAEVISDKGWAQDMRPFLLQRIAEHDVYTNLSILQAAAALRDPAAYDDLIWHFENNQNGTNIYDAIKNLPGIQLKEAVLRVWAASKSWTGWEADRRYTLAVAAMEYGVADALEFAVERLDSPSPGQWYRDLLRRAVRARTGLRGSDDEIRAWFRANKGKIIFDENRRMFLPNG